MGMAEKIKERRLEMGYTQEELAEKLGLQKSAVAKYENGRVENIKRTVILNMAEIFNCSPTYLMDWEDDLQDEEIRENISQNIAYYRRKIGLTQTELAGKIGVRPTTVSTWERGASSPNAETLYELCKIFNISLDEIYGVQEEITSVPTTIAAHIDSNEYSNDELEEIMKFAEFVKNKRN